jgi:hypothetical protein
MTRSWKAMIRVNDGCYGRERADIKPSKSERRNLL